MLRSVEHVDEPACTVFAMDIAIGGLLLTDEDRWLWGIFAFSDSDARSREASPFGGYAATKEQALAALEDRWNAWLAAAGLICRPELQIQ